MPTIQLPFETLLEATEQLDRVQLETLILRAHEVKQREQHREEERLLAIWQQPVLQPKDRAHLEELCRRLEDENISQTERQELLRLNDEGNEVQVKRLQAVLDLAHLRGVEPAALLAELESRSV